MLAERNGTTLAKAYTDYWNLEKAVRQDPIEVVAQLWRAMGIDPQVATAQTVERILPSYPKEVFAAGFEQGYAAGTAASLAAHEEELMKRQATPSYRSNGATARNPATHAVLSRMAGKATIGAPSSAAPKKNYYDSSSTEDAVRKALAAQRGG